MLSWIRAPLVALVLVTLGLGSTGCNKVDEPSRAMLAASALAAKERAAAFDAIKGQLEAKNTAEKPFVDAYIVSHAQGLNAQAVALADLVEAVKSGSGLSDRAREALAVEAETAEARAANAENWRAVIQGPPEAEAYLVSHSNALAAQATALRQLTNALKKK